MGGNRVETMEAAWLCLRPRYRGGRWSGRQGVEEERGTERFEMWETPCGIAWHGMVPRSRGEGKLKIDGTVVKLGNGLRG